MREHQDREAFPRATRPNMRNYGISEHEEGLLSWEWVSDRMSRSQNYWIITTRPNGRPHAVPVWGAWADEMLYFGTEPNSHRVRNQAHNPNVVVHLESEDEVVISEGIASFHHQQARL